MASWYGEAFSGSRLCYCELLGHTARVTFTACADAKQTGVSLLQCKVIKNKGHNELAE